MIKRLRSIRGVPLLDVYSPQRFCLTYWYWYPVSNVLLGATPSSLFFKEKKRVIVKVFLQL